MKNASPRVTGTDRLKDLGSHVTGMGERIGEIVSETADVARDRAGHLYDGARKSLAQGAKSTRVIVRKHPLESVLVAIGVGLVVGAISTLFYSRRES